MSVKIRKVLHIIFIRQETLQQTSKIPILTT